MCAILTYFSFFSLDLMDLYWYGCYSRVQLPKSNHVMSITHRGVRIRVIDSFNILPMDFAKLPACFGLKENRKGTLSQQYNNLLSYFLLYIFITCIIKTLIAYSDVTISSCIAVFRSTHIQDHIIAMVPVHGYANGTNFSVDSLRWLDYAAQIEGISIQHFLKDL